MPASIYSFPQRKPGQTYANPVTQERVSNMYSRYADWNKDRPAPAVAPIRFERSAKLFFCDKNVLKHSIGMPVSSRMGTVDDQDITTPVDDFSRFVSRKYFGMCLHMPHPTRPTSRDRFSLDVLKWFYRRTSRKSISFWWLSCAKHSK